MTGPREITVDLLQQMSPNKGGLKSWLGHIGLSPEDADNYVEENVPKMGPSEVLPAMAAKRCYASYVPGLNPNVQRVRDDWRDFIENLLIQGHGCYDEETDVLTSEGWVPWPKITGKEFLCSLDPETRHIEYLPIKRVIRYQHSGEMVKVSAQGVDLLVTPNHKMWACPTGTREGRRRECFTLIEAASLVDVSHAYSKTGVWHRSPGSYSTDELTMLGFCIGDGSVQPSGAQLKFHLRRERKIIFLTQLCARLDWNLKSRGDHYIVDVPVKLRELFLSIYNEHREKIIPSGVLLGESRDALRGLYDGLVQSDGHVGRTCVSYDTTSPMLADQFQHLALHVGLAANVAYTYSKEDGRRASSYGSRPLTRLTAVRRQLQPEVNKWSGAEGRAFKIKNWNGEVYCAELFKNHIMYVRRGGRPVWSGNSTLEHSSFTFGIEGLTRVATAELNRHRAGAAISEASMRYIRFEDDGISYWLPLSIREDPLDSPALAAKKRLTRDTFQRVFEMISREYNSLVSIWELDKEGTNFAFKKKITSMLRRIIPMGVSTGGVWTFNLRAIRHVLTLRCSPGAEEEICLVMSLVAKLAIEQLPNVMQDFEQTPGGFWVPKYKKV